MAGPKKKESLVVVSLTFTLKSIVSVCRRIAHCCAVGCLLGENRKEGRKEGRPRRELNCESKKGRKGGGGAKNFRMREHVEVWIILEQLKSHDDIVNRKLERPHRCHTRRVQNADVS